MNAECSFLVFDKIQLGEEVHGTRKVVFFIYFIFIILFIPSYRVLDFPMGNNNGFRND